MSDIEVVFEKNYGKEVTKIYAGFKSNGDLDISGYDAGPLLEKIYGDDDYEYGMTISKSDLEKFASILGGAGYSVPEPIISNLIQTLKSAFDGGVKFRTLKSLCSEKGLDVQSWTY
jgi:hypothetical protein